MRGSSDRERAVLNAMGVVVLAVGLVSAGIVYWSGRDFSAGQSKDAGAGWQDSTLSAADSKRSARDSEMYFGKIGRVVMKAEDPETLAMMIAAVSAVVAIGCFVVANRGSSTSSDSSKSPD